MEVFTYFKYLNKERSQWLWDSGGFCIRLASGCYPRASGAGTDPVESGTVSTLPVKYLHSRATTRNEPGSMRIYKVYSGIGPQSIFRIAKGNFSSRLSALVIGHVWTTLSKGSKMAKGSASSPREAGCVSQEWPTLTLEKASFPFLASRQCFNKSKI